MTKVIAHLLTTSITQDRPTEFKIDILYHIYESTWNPELSGPKSASMGAFVSVLAKPREIDEAVEAAILAHILDQFSLVISRDDLVYHAGFQRG